MSPDKHQEFFDLLAAEWDLMFTLEDMERLSRLVEGLGAKEGMDIIDLGCGTGILFDMLRRKVGPSGSVTGVDFSLQMAVRAHRNFPFFNVNVVDGDAVSLPFADSSFDMGVAFAAFPHFSDKQQAIDEIHRVLKPGARFIIFHLSSSEELSDIHHQIGGVVEHDEIPSAARLHEMFNSSRFSNLTIDDYPGFYMASADNNK